MNTAGDGDGRPDLPAGSAGQALSDDVYADPDVTQFYDLANQVRSDFDYCIALASGAGSVLDLGCGTGTLPAALADGRSVTGVDPAAAMLDIARRRPGGDAVTWRQADARTVRLGETFDLVVLTGHAFQVFLTAGDQAAVLATIAGHLNPDGRFIFDSRNPAYGVRENRNRADTIRELDHPRLGRIEAWNESRYDSEAGILSYRNGFTVVESGETYAGSARIRYTPQPLLAEMIEAAGLAVDRWLGDWHGTPFHETAKEIIPVGRLA